jgi:secretion/DNA translocation related CpaE-like protein
MSVGGEAMGMSYLTESATDLTTRPSDHPSAPLLVSADEDLLNELMQLTAAADVAPDIARDPFEAVRRWARAPVVLVGVDLAGPLAEVAPEARDHTYLVSRGAPPDGAYPLALALGARQVIDVTVSSGWLVELLGDITEDRPERGRVIGVIGGTGGAGTTTFAAALGQWAQRSGDAAVIDCDPQGPGLDRVLGMEVAEGFRWDALCTTSGRLSARALREALPRQGRLGVLSWYVDATPQTLQAFAVRQALSAARRGHQTVVLDLPRTPDRLIDEIASRCDRLLVMTVCGVAGVAGAARMRARFAEHPGVGVVLRGESLSAAEVSRAVRLPVLTQMRDQRGVTESIDLGLGPLRTARGPLAQACADILGSMPIETGELS